MKGVELIDYDLDDHISNIINTLKVNANLLELKI